ncbi:MAG TPA: DUF4097 family beta strand repeat-containing protein [Gemmatimonadales bacterium]|jgi:hypothetical protein|nr:DUF4097 family beta strand repeat-containing protein [Gemmatimonadales bacterium]
MLLPMLALLALQASQGFQTDTTVNVNQGTRLKVENQGGDIIVKTWEKNQVRVQASHSRRTHVTINLGGAVLSLEAEADRGPSNMVDYELTVPAWMALSLEGMYATVNVKGTRAPIEVETIDGDITVEGGAESVKLTSVQGRISATGSRGRIELNTVSDDIEAADLQGDIVAETVSGSITIAKSDAKSVEVQTVSGELVYDGKIVDGGHYSLLTHSGEIAVSVPEGANATIATAIGSGEVRASFPLPASERPSRRRQTFRLGTGSATVELESFSGTISLLRPSELAGRLERLLQRRDERERVKHKAKPDHDGDDDDQGGN